jgi:hypothetical protein
MLNSSANPKVNLEGSLLSTEIGLAAEYVELVRRKYPSFEFPSYKLRQWFERRLQIFFDCGEADIQACLQEILRETGFHAFTIFFVVKESNNTYKLMDATFRNLGTETLQHFITRFHSQLESMTKLGVQASGLEYIECIGHSYEETVE